MRVIQAHRNTPKTNNKPVIKIVLITAVILFALVFFYTRKSILISRPVTIISKTQSEQANRYKKENLTDLEFVELLQSVVLPNTKPILKTPEFTNDQQANQRIQKIVESRGFRLTSVPSFGSLAPITEDKPYQLQPLADNAWREMKDEASRANIPLSITRSFESVEEHQSKFFGALEQQQIDIAKLASGQADNQIVQIIYEVDPPGFSWLHSGYGIALGCGSGKQDFRTTTCYKWLSENSYLNARRFGWVPQMLAGDHSNNLGTRANRFVWVGIEAPTR